jgi:hypothetical protein
MTETEGYSAKNARDFATKYASAESEKQLAQSFWRDHDLLVEQYRWGASVQDIAKVLQRDELAVAYRILERLTPQIPGRTLEALGLEDMAAQLRKAEGMDEGSDKTRICPDCRDVILYCTCQIEGGRFF